MSNRRQIEQRVIQAAESALYRQNYVSPLDVLTGMGTLQPSDVQDWKKGKLLILKGLSREA